MNAPETDLRILKLLDDICTSANRILMMLKNETVDSFLSPSSMILQDAVARRFTIIGKHQQHFSENIPHSVNKISKYPSAKPAI